MSVSTTHSFDGKAWLQQLDWRQFEHLVGTAYQRQGYTVLPTSPGADGGIDLVLVRGQERIFVQCKHWKAWQVGAPVVRELFGLVVANRATRGVVVTSGTYSREAIEFARQTGTELLDGPAVMTLVAIGNRHTFGPPADAELNTPVRPQVTVPSTGAPACPVCLSPMVLRRARRGPYAGSPFWGCVRFPGCRGTLQATPGTAMPATQRQVERQKAHTRAFVNLVVMLVGVVLIPLFLMFAMPLLIAGLFR